MMLSTTSIDTFTAAPGVIQSWIQSNLQSGPYGVLALTAIASAIQIPITQYRSFYSISVGYGLTIAAIATALMCQFQVQVNWLNPASLASLAAVVYGLRLGSYLLWRERRRARTLASHSSELARPKRVGLALSVSLLYACMTTPLLYALRALPSQKYPRIMAYVGASLAWMGMLTEAIADAHKYTVKARSTNHKQFMGPTGGLYRITRHPNYTGEILFWLGLYVTGVPSFGDSIVGWIASSLGLATIGSVMMSAAKRLDQRQQENYGGQALYEQWKTQVPSSLFPMVHERSSLR